MMQEIAADMLVPHPSNSNYMDANTTDKLQRHIECTGNYEPLAVRPHSSRGGKFQILNGHNRFRVLRDIGYTAINCVVWDVNDKQARLYLATLNRLSGRDVPERRAILLEDLLADFNVDDLAMLLPETFEQLEELQKLASAELGDLSDTILTDEQFPTANPVLMDFMLSEHDAREVNQALDLATDVAEGTASRGQALLRICRFYIANHDPTRRGSVETDE